MNFCLNTVIIIAIFFFFCSIICFVLRLCLLFGYLIDSVMVNQCRCSAWARWVVTRVSHEHRDRMLIYVCCVQNVF